LLKINYKTKIAKPIKTKLIEMVRNYVPTKPRPYKKEDVTAAVEHYFAQPEGSITIKEVGEIFKIPRKTFILVFYFSTL